jgi:uncharacterized protein YicC (UPF0701 family)
MAASSMTGFGRAEINLPGVRLSVEVATVNQKNLQVSVFGPDAWPALESAASGWIRARLQRGKVTARVTQAAASATTNANGIKKRSPTASTNSVRSPNTAA